MDSTTSTGTYTINPPRQYGWVCPICGKVNAPWLSQCPCAGTTPIKWSSPEWTCTLNHTTVTNE